jgi:hypothetical protein
MVSITYIVYGNSTSGSSIDKKNFSKIPWLDPSGHKKTINENQFQKVNNNLPKFVITDNTEVIDVSDNNDNNDNTKGIKKGF